MPDRLALQNHNKDQTLIRLIFVNQIGPLENLKALIYKPMFANKHKKYQLAVFYKQS